MKAISVLGSTGSIGTQTLQIAEEFPNEFKVVALTAGRNLQLVIEQIQKHNPEVVALADKSLLPELVNRLESIYREKTSQRIPEILGGEDGLKTVAAWGNADIVVTGIVGYAGLQPTLSAIRAGKDLALANKETLIAAGPVVIPELSKSGSRLLPADSEHSAIFQCLQGDPLPENARSSTGIPTPGLNSIQLTASGGAFRDWSLNDLKKATIEDATSHPNWNMGKKITVDSATLMNKGLEVIEAHYLFGLDYEQIDILIHPQSIIHSMIQLDDSSVIAQLGWPDMKLPILYCLSWPKRFSTPWPKLDLAKIRELTFEKPDRKKYPCMELAYSAGKTGGTMTASLNAANEESVDLFLKGKIHFLDIPKLIEMTCDKHKQDLIQKPSLDDIIAVDEWSRVKARELAKSSFI